MMMPGLVLGDRYKVQRQLGKKSSRQTLLAQDLTTDDLVIIKLLIVDDGLQPNDLKLFKREAEALKLLCHPSTPRYLDYFETELPSIGRAMALIQTYLNGSSLAEYVEQGRLLMESDARHVARETLAILTYLHHLEPPIIHRDIRPNNILLSAEPKTDQSQVFLVDFGSVKSLSSGDTALTQVGMDGFMPPEQASGLALAVSDLYSLGATLISAMTGVHPSTLQHGSLRIDFESAISLSSDWSDWLKKLIALSLDQRWKSAKEALDALDQLGDE